MPWLRGKLKFRFSLRTLLLFVLLCGGVMTVRHNWPPLWTATHRLPLDVKPIRLGFSPDDSVIFALKKSETAGHTLDFFEASTGIKTYSISTGADYAVPKFSPNGRYFAVQDPRARKFLGIR